MQFAKFEIQLGGEMKNTVIRDNISPAECLVLQAMHGEHSLRPICITSERRMETKDLMEYLTQRFGRPNFSGRMSKKRSALALNAVFPGGRPINVPSKFEDIGMYDIPLEDDDKKEELKSSGLSEEQAKAVVDATNAKVAEKEAEAEKSKDVKPEPISETDVEGPEDEQKKEKPKTKKAAKKKKYEPKDSDKLDEEITIKYDD